MYKKVVYAFLIKLLATTIQLFRRNSICCLKIQAIFSQSEHRDRLHPLPLFVFTRFLRTPPPTPQLTLY